MGTLPQLLDEDLRRLNAVFTEFLGKSEASAALLLAEGGFIVSQYGQIDGADMTSIGALASNSFEANKMMAGLMGEPNFSSIYQAGEKLSLFAQSIDGFNLMVVIFPVGVAVGLIKYYAETTREKVAAIFKQAKDRAPGEGLDLVMMNPVDSAQIFKRSA